MRLLIASSKRFSIEAPDDGNIRSVKRLISDRTGLPIEMQSLSFGGRQLEDRARLKHLDVRDGTMLSLCGRVRGGKSLKLTVKPRVQKDKWSLYWKIEPMMQESMETKTESLDDVILQLSPTDKVADIHAALRSKIAWPSGETSERLEGFKDPWEVALHKGITLKSDSTLESVGITQDSTVVCVRRVLIPEAWKIIEEGQDDDDLSSDSDW